MAAHRRIGRPPLSDAEKERRKRLREAPEPRPVTISAPEPPKPKGVQDGDVFKHYVEHDYYCVLVSDDKNIKYAVLKDTHSWSKFKELNHEVMLKGARVMTKSNADAIAGVEWIHQGNIVKSWGG